MWKTLRIVLLLALGSFVTSCGSAHVGFHEFVDRCENVLMSFDIVECVWAVLFNPAER